MTETEHKPAAIETKRFTFGDGHKPPDPPLAPPDAEDSRGDWWEGFFDQQGIFAGRDE